MAEQTFELVDPVTPLNRGVYVLADKTLLHPDNANPLVAGEFMQLDADGNMIRGDGSVPAFAVLDGYGRADTQALGSVALLTTGQYIANTYVYDAVASPALGNKLMVATVTNAAKSLASKSGLKIHGGGTEIICGFVLRPAASNNGYLQFIRATV